MGLVEGADVTPTHTVAASEPAEHSGGSAVALEQGKGQDVELVNEQLAKPGLPGLTTGLTLMLFPKALVPCPRDLYYRG